MIIVRLLIGLIKIYRLVVAPWLPGQCRFPVTCSEYAMDSLQRLGLIKGLWRSCIRILSCHPLKKSDF